MEVKGVEIARLIYAWANESRMHPDDFDTLFVEELLEMLEADE
jgi:hypothetical protein